MSRLDPQTVWLSPNGASWNIRVDWVAIEGVATPIGLTIIAANGREKLTSEVMRSLRVGEIIETTRPSRNTKSAVPRSGGGPNPHLRHDCGGHEVP